MNNSFIVIDTIQQQTHFIFQQNIYDSSYNDYDDFENDDFGNDIMMNLNDKYFDDNNENDYKEEEKSLKSISLYQVHENYKLVLKKKIFNRFEKK